MWIFSWLLSRYLYGRSRGWVSVTDEKRWLVVIHIHIYIAFRESESQRESQSQREREGEIQIQRSH